MVTMRLPSRSWLLLALGGGLAIAAILSVGWPLSAGSSLTAAHTAMAQRREADAIPLLSEAIGQNRESAEAAYLKARCHRRLSQPREFRRSLALAAGLGYPQEALDREQTLLLTQEGMLAVNSGDVAALLAAPGDDTLDIYEAVVRGCVVSLQLDEADLFLDGWLADYPDDPLPRYYRGLLAENRWQWSEAVAAFQGAIENGMPPRGDAYLHLAEAQRQAYRYRDALATYALCDNTRVEVLRGRAACLESLRDLDGAREIYRQLLQSTPDDAAALTAAGRIDAKRGEHAEAKILLERAIAVTPSDVRAWHSLAWTLVNLGENDQATEAFREAMRLTEQIQLTEHLRQRVDEDPSDVQSRLRLGEIMLKEGRTEDGRMWLRSVLQIDPANTAAQELLERLSQSDRL